jgi:hypothetical protein
MLLPLSCDAPCGGLLRMLDQESVGGNRRHNTPFRSFAKPLNPYYMIKNLMYIESSIVEVLRSVATQAAAIHRLLILSVCDKRAPLYFD